MEKVYLKTSKEVMASLHTEQTIGLSDEEVKRRIHKYGENKLVSKKGRTIWAMILEQFTDFLIIILIIAAIASIGVGETVDGIVIIGIVILNAMLSVIQENKANNALEALQKMAAAKAKVLRGGKLIKVLSTELVPGDIVYLEAGDYIPADFRLFLSVNLQVNESSLTGESVSSDKDADAVIEQEVGVGDCVNMVFAGTIVTYGRGRGIVTGTGMNTQIGQIAQMIQDVEEEKTPLQNKLADLGKLLGIACIIVCVIIFAIGIFRKMPLIEIFMTAVSLAVAAIPEGLPAVVTAVLAIGMQKMTKQNAILKKLSAVETLGSTTVICSDKTGTLTQNKMTVVRIYDGQNFWKVTGTGYRIEGDIICENNPEIVQSLGLEETIKAGVLCNDALYKKEESDIIGDPTEGALVVLGEKAGQSKSALKKEYPRIGELAFDSDRKLMSTFHKDVKAPTEDTVRIYTKGAPDIILSRATHFIKDGQIIPLTEEKRAEIMDANTYFAKDALRVLGFAFKEVQQVPGDEDIERDLIFAGLSGIIDPPREEAKKAIAQCGKAGIQVVMITGDHKITGGAIAKQLGIIDDDAQSIDGLELDQYSDEELVDLVGNYRVYARVSPQHKVRIVKAIRASKNIVAMTGDGVNDAPALKQADIGIAMGITGTDVAKEAADMILTDDNFASIVAAVEEGRTIYSNIRKFIGFLISCNMGELLLIFVAMLLGKDIPLLPIHLLWINLITDSFPAFSLGLEPKEEGIMDQPPRDPNEPIIDKRMRVALPIQSITLALAAYLSFLYGHTIEIYPNTMDTARTCAFITLSVGELLRAYSARSETKPLYKMKIFSNRYLNISVIVSLVLLIGVVYIPFFQPIFHTVGLTKSELSVVLALALIPLVGGELGKLITNKR